MVHICARSTYIHTYIYTYFEGKHVIPSCLPSKYVYMYVCESTELSETDTFDPVYLDLTTEHHRIRTGFREMRRTMAFTRPVCGADSLSRQQRRRALGGA